MAKKKQVYTFFKGKNISGVGARSPVKGVPNTNIDFYDIATGKLKVRRKINEIGNAVKDLDVKHEDHGDSDHMHVFVKKDGIIVRGPAQGLDKKDERELNKAKKKRRLLRK